MLQTMMQTTKVLALRGGRRLEVAEYGDPAGHPALFFHGLLGSHHQASFFAEQAREYGLRIIAPNRPGVGRSEFVVRTSAREAVADVAAVAAACGVDDFSVIGISGGAPYALATLAGLGPRVRTATLISGMGPTRLRGALRGQRRADRIALELGSRHPGLARRVFRRWSERFRDDPDRFLRRFVAKLVPADRRLFQRDDLCDMFLQDLRQVFLEGRGPENLAQELAIYRNFALPLGELRADRCVSLWHGLDDDLVPPAMTFQVARRLPNCEAHFVPGGHFVAAAISEQIIARLRHLIDAAPSSPS